MTVSLDAQTGGSLVVIGGFAASEAAARLLDWRPSSTLAWYLHLELFRPFELARAETSPLSLLFGSNALCVDVALIVLIVLARVFRFRFGIAFLANLSFGIAVALTHAWLWRPPALATASLVGIGIPEGPDGVLVGFMLAASFAAFLVSHASFLSTILLPRPHSTET